MLVNNESFLKFSLNQFTNAGANPTVYRWDSCGAHGLIQRIRVFHGSNLLSDIDNYGVLSKILFDLQVPTDSSYGKYNIPSTCHVYTMYNLCHVCTMYNRVHTFLNSI